MIESIPLGASLRLDEAPNSASAVGEENVSAEHLAKRVNALDIDAGERGRFGALDANPGALPLARA